MRDISLDIFVDVYNRFAEIHQVKQTNKRGIARRLINAQCGFMPGDNMITERQLMALFIASYKGKRENRNRQILLFSDIGDTLFSTISFFSVSVILQEFKNKEQKTMARAAKRAINNMLMRSTVDKTIMMYEKSMREPCTDKERIQHAKEAISKVEDKTMLIELFDAHCDTGVFNEEAAG